MPLAIMTAMESSLGAALGLSALLLGLSALALGVLALLLGRRRGAGPMRGSGGSGGDSDRAGAGDPAGAWGEFTVGVGGFPADAVVPCRFGGDTGAVRAIGGGQDDGAAGDCRAGASRCGRIVIAGQTVFAAGGNKGDGTSGYDGNVGSRGNSDGRNGDGDGCGYGRPVWVAPHRRRVGYVTQQSHLFPHLTVAQTLPTGCRIGGGRRRGSGWRELVRRLRLDGLETRPGGAAVGGAAAAGGAGPGAGAGAGAAAAGRTFCGAGYGIAPGAGGGAARRHSSDWHCSDKRFCDRHSDDGRAGDSGDAQQGGGAGAGGYGAGY